MYLGPVFALIRVHWRWFAVLTLIGAAARVFFIHNFPVVTPDTELYADLARNMLTHHIYGQTDQGMVAVSLARLPGYPLFLAAIFGVFGIEHYKTAMAVQAVFDVLTCLLIADTARRMFRGFSWAGTAARWAFLLAALCPFTISYVSCALTESLEIFFTALATHQALVAFQERELRHWAGCGAALACAILLRPDGGLLLGSIGLVVLGQLWRERERRRELFIGGLITAVLALAPLGPWALRNWRAFHVFQPLVNPYAANPGEEVLHGFGNWEQTFAFDYTTTEDFDFKIPGEALDISDAPARAFDGPDDFQQVSALFDEYNGNGFELTPQLSAQFDAIAARKVRQHPLRCRLVMPLARVLDMWFRPRTEMLPLNSHWWDYHTDPGDCAWSIGLGLWALALFTAAALAVWKARATPLLALLLIYPLARSVFLAGFGASEQRYSVECFPAVLVLAGAWTAMALASRRKKTAERGLATASGSR